MPKSKDVEVSAQELAEMLGITAKSVAGLAVKNEAVRARRSRYWRNASTQAYCASLRTAAAGRGSPAAEARARLITVQAAAAEREELLALGKALPTDAVEARWTANWREARAVLMSIPTRLAQRTHLSRQDLDEFEAELRDRLEELGTRNGGGNYHSNGASQ